ncbi:MAG: pantoate--beta-alanine ligase [Rickettsiales bacterium]|nr:MAG: pantoate--beta-alanine ligase [Rickettsiales bacterium]
MIIVESIAKWMEIRKNIKHQSIGFIPTMGNLHLGHSSLIEKSIIDNDITIVSIYINPAQFDDQNDFINYPKTLNDDLEILRKLKIDYLFLPITKDIYPDEFSFRILNDSNYSRIMEGEARKGHFSGMLTIVMKLLNIVKADNAYFGEKDYQQLRLVELMTKAFFIDTIIVPCKTIRNEYGVAMSSRNNRLSGEELKKISIFPKLLGSNLPDDIIISELEKEFIVDYIKTIDNRRFGAIIVNNVRLIDNMEI